MPILTVKSTLTNLWNQQESFSMAKLYVAYVTYEMLNIETIFLLIQLYELILTSFSKNSCFSHPRPLTFHPLTDKACL